MNGKHSLPGIDRRRVLKTALAAAGGLPAIRRAGGSPAPDDHAHPAPDLIDTNVYLSRWPWRRVRLDDTAALAARLREAGVTAAWAGSFDGLFHRDIAAVNTRLVAECKCHGDGLLVPFGSINPCLSDWEDDLRRCAEEHGMNGIRLHPGYHGYGFEHPAFARLLRLATERGLLVQIVLEMEDRRAMHPLLRIEPPDLGPLAALVRRTPGLRLILLNALRIARAGARLSDLMNAGDVSVEIAMLEGVGGVSNLLAQTPVERVLFGSHSPLFYFEAALLKLRESPLSENQLRAIRCANARRLLARSGT